jgi:ABC-type branched-subunit amino acid transport system ATPase component
MTGSTQNIRSASTRPPRVIEQNFRLARDVGDEVRVMDNGRILHRGRMAA